MVDQSDKVKGPLGDKKIAKLTRDGKRAVGLHPDQDGLYLQVTEHGSSWLQRITVKSKRRWMGLGDLSRVPLADAREAGAKARRLAKQGIDPIEQRIMQKSADAAPRFTFKLATNRYYDVHQGEWRSDKTRNIYRQTMRDHVFPAIGDKAVRSVTVADILTIVRRSGLPGRPPPGCVPWRGWRASSMPPAARMAGCRRTLEIPPSGKAQGRPRYTTEAAPGCPPSGYALAASAGVHGAAACDRGHHPPARWNSRY